MEVSGNKKWLSAHRAQSFRRIFWGRSGGDTHREEGCVGRVKHLIEKQKDHIVKDIESPVEESEVFFMKA